MRLHVILRLLILTVSSSAFLEVSLKPRFSLYWNFPDRCSRAMKEIDYFSFLDEYNIIRNSNGSIYGDKITLIYSTSFKYYPHLEINKTSREIITEIEGGIPQKTNFTAFFSYAADVIERQIPDIFFDGPAVLDFEEYRFLYQYNWGWRTPYQKKSDEYTIEKYPNISEKAIRARSEYEFNKAARKTVLGLLRLGKKLRPYAKWGFYLMPECLGHNDINSSDCNGLRDYNDEMTVLFNEQTAMYPSIYLGNNKTTNYRATQIRLRDARRYSLTTLGRTPIFAYTKFEYDAYSYPTWFYSKADLCASLQGSFEEGVDGIILWGPDRNPWKERCPAIKDYIQRVLGPVLINIQKKAEKCSRKICSDHGKCLRASDLFDEVCKWSMKDKMKRMKCLCDEGYYGEHCQYHRTPGKKNPIKPFKKKKITIPISTVVTPTFTSTLNEIAAMTVLPPPF